MEMAMVCLGDWGGAEGHDLFVEELFELFAADIVLVYCQYDEYACALVKLEYLRSNSKNSGSSGGATGSSSGSC